jgi:hypothetical protein
VTIAPELEATGWKPVRDSNGRYWQHAKRYPGFTFDSDEARQLDRNRRATVKLKRAARCRCRHPYGRLEEGICWKCGRRVS